MGKQNDKRAKGKVKGLLGNWRNKIAVRLFAFSLFSYFAM